MGELPRHPQRPQGTLPLADIYHGFVYGRPPLLTRCYPTPLPHPSPSQAYGDLDPRFLDEINLADPAGAPGGAPEPLLGPHGRVRSVFPTTEESRRKNYKQCYSEESRLRHCGRGGAPEAAGAASSGAGNGHGHPNNGKTSGLVQSLSPRSTWLKTGPAAAAPATPPTTAAAAAASTDDVSAAQDTPFQSATISTMTPTAAATATTAVTGAATGAATVSTAAASASASAAAAASAAVSATVGGVDDDDLYNEFNDVVVPFEDEELERQKRVRPSPVCSTFPSPSMHCPRALFIMASDPFEVAAQSPAKPLIAPCLLFHPLSPVVPASCPPLLRRCVNSARCRCPWWTRPRAWCTSWASSSPSARSGAPSSSPTSCPRAKACTSLPR